MSDSWRDGVIREAPAGGVRGTVIKFGGSLFVRPRWADELLSLVSRADGPVSVIVGGGGLVDGLRAIDAASPLPATLTHRLAIDALALTARLAAVATGLQLVSEPGVADAAVLDVPAWLSVGHRLAKLPVGWHVTSDSIAAEVAAASGAVLMLAKSLPPPTTDVDVAAAAGWVDPWFPTAARGVPSIRWAAPEAAG